MISLWLLLGLLALGSTGARSDNTDGDERRTQAFGAFSRGETLSWDQLEVVATEAGVSREKIAEMKVKDRAERLVRRFHLPLELAGFSGGMAPEEEFRLYKGHRPGYGALVLNTAFWDKQAETYDNDPYITYLLFRAEAYFTYRSRYDAEQGAWIVEEESPSMQTLKAALDDSAANWMITDDPPTGRDLEFRKSLDPAGNSPRALKALVEYALRTVAQKASDNWAAGRYRRELGVTSPLVSERIRRRERLLAVDFNRARSAMTGAERRAFRKLLKTPFRYVRHPGEAASEPVFDPAANVAP